MTCSIENLRKDLIRRLLDAPEEVLMRVHDAAFSPLSPDQGPPDLVVRAYRSKAHWDGRNASRKRGAVIAAIKQLRAMTGLPLFMAKRQIESWEQDGLLVLDGTEPMT